MIDILYQISWSQPLDELLCNGLWVHNQWPSAAQGDTLAQIPQQHVVQLAHLSKSNKKSEKFLERKGAGTSRPRVARLMPHCSAAVSRARAASLFKPWQTAPTPGQSFVLLALHWPHAAKWLRRRSPPRPVARPNQPRHMHPKLPG